METITVYKVCHVRDDGTLELYSAEDEYNKVYEIGVECVPDIGRLFAFLKLEDALKIKSSADVILVGTCNNYINAPDKLSALTCFYNEFWENNFHVVGMLNGRWSIDTPMGTVLIDSFIPTEVVLIPSPF